MQQAILVTATWPHIEEQQGSGMAITEVSLVTGSRRTAGIRRLVVAVRVMAVRTWWQKKSHDPEKWLEHVRVGVVPDPGSGAAGGR
jgi:hypothetical protein